MTPFSQNKQPGAGNSDIIISACAIKTVAGDEPYFNGAALSTKMNFSRPSEVYEQQDRKLQYKSVLINEMEEVEGYEDIDRIYFLLESTLLELIEPYEDILENKKLLICCMIPPELSDRGDYIDTEQWLEDLRDTHILLEQATIKLIHANKTSSIEILSSIQEQLHNQDYEFTIFGGADSLLDSVTFTNLAIARKLQTVQAPDGLVLSEGAGFILLQTADSFNTVDLTEEDIQYVNWGQIASLNFQQTKENVNGTAKGAQLAKQMIDAALATSPIDLEKIDTVFTSLGASVKSQLEWYQLSQLLWAPQISEQQRSAIMLGELSDEEKNQLNQGKRAKIMATHRTVGEVGAASFPIQLILALASFENDQTYKQFGFKQSENILVLDTTHEESRGVLLLAAPQEELQRKQFGNESEDDMETGQWAM